MKKYSIPVLFVLLNTLFFFNCGKKGSMLDGNVYYHDADTLSYIVGFDKDTLYYIIRGPKQNISHKSRYSVKKVNDSDYVIDVEKKPVFWDKNTWEIVMDNKKGFYSAESKNYYKYSEDKNILR